MDDKINVCLACDDNYAKYAGVVIASVLANADASDEIAFYILDGGISDEHKSEINELKSIKDCDINFVQINEELFEDYKRVKTHDYVTLATYYRLKLPSLLPNLHRVIYFDCDFVVNKSLKEIFYANIDNAAVAGVLDIDRRKVRKNPTYVNAGMLVFDIDKMKEQNLEQKFLDWTREHINTIKTGDQEIINEVLKGQIFILDEKWNVQSSNFTNRSSYTKTPYAIHFVAKKKPWHWASFSVHRDLYFKYLQMTPWKLSDEELKHWTADNQKASLIAYLKYRPLFLFRPKFYKAFYCTYLQDFAEKIFSVKDYKETHKIVYILGLKIKFPKTEYIRKQKSNPYEIYKKNNFDITRIPPATGQIREIQLANLELLKELDFVCRQNGLKYWLDFGTLLGAIRHKGFIPWDDDIDTGMMRNDYDKIIDAFKELSRNPDIYAQYEFLGKGQTIIKVKHKKCPHLFVDIFPHDYSNAVETEENRISKTKELNELRQKFNKMKDLDNSAKVLGKVQEFNRKFIPDIYVEKSDIQCGLDYSFTEPIWIHSYDTIFPLKEIVFEDFNAMCINKPEQYLSDIFGNYMGYPKKFGYGHSMYVSLSEEEKKYINVLCKGEK